MTPALCVYRGINDFAYGPTGAGVVRAEWMDGIRTDASGKYEVWGEAGGSYNTTAIATPIYSDESTRYGQSIMTGGMFDSLFMAAALGLDSTCMIPDLNGGRSATSNTGRICYSNFYADNGENGAFYSNFEFVLSSTATPIGSRLAKW